MADSKISLLPALTTPEDSDLFPIVDTSASATKKISFGSLYSALQPQNFVFVDSASDLPAPVSSVITLAANTTYFITVNLDLGGSRLVCSQNTTIIGGSSENCSISSTGLSALSPLISSQWSLPIRNISFTHDYVLDLDASGNADQAIDWFGVNFLNCANVGRVANYTNFIMTDSSLLNSSGLEFDGSIGTIGFTQCLFDSSTGGTAIIIPATANITRRLRIIYSSFVTMAGETSLDVSTSATIPIEGYILDTINFSGGGTYLAGIQSDDNKALFSNCRGVANTFSIANYYVRDNLVATDITNSGVAVKAAGTTSAGSIVKFTHTNNRATYVGALTQTFVISATLTCTSGNNNQIGIYIAKNGSLIPESEVYSTTSGAGRAENITVQALVQMSTNDFVEIWVENSSATTDIVVSYLNVIVTEI
jgi:hypothetical protein